MTFNSLEFSQVNLYLGVWGGKRGKIWWDDVRLEPGGLVNVVRRDGAPLRVTSADGQTVYQEGRDFQNARDPKLGMIPWPGGFTAWHEPPVITVPPGSRIRDGQKVLLSYYHTALIYEDQVMCCMAEPKVYEILRWQLAQVHKHLQPDGYFLQHDEIRVQGWDESCRRTGKTPGELLAENVRKCVELVRGEDPGKPIYVWSDMFDPHHNAAQDRPVLPGQGRRAVVRLVEGPGQGRDDRQLELGPRQAGRVAAGTSPAWATGRSWPATTTARWPRSAAGSATAARCRHHRGDVHDVAAALRDLEAFARQLEKP